MNLLPLIHKKRLKQNLSSQEINAFVKSLTSSKAPPDYQIASLLAFTVANGMNDEETFALTTAMKNSGKPFAYKGFPKNSFFLDKHSTGGVGDKITLPLAPLVIAATENVYFPTIAGRGLGHTGGTVDKLESIPGFRCGLEMSRFYKILKKQRLAFLSQTPKIAPADRILYALRDVSGTVASVPLITASILSKKLSESLNYLLIDLKVGSGAFLTDPQMSEALARQMLNVLRHFKVGGRICMTNMDTPLGHYSGNLLEVYESLEILKGVGPKNSTRLSLEFAERLSEASGISKSESVSKVKAALHSGKALEVFEKSIEAQGGKLASMHKATANSLKLKTKSILCPQAGYLRFDVTQLGTALVDLGGGRMIKAAKIDPSVGFYHPHQTGDRVEKGEEVLKIYYRDSKKLSLALGRLSQAVFVQEDPLEKMPLIVKELQQ